MPKLNSTLTNLKNKLKFFFMRIRTKIRESHEKRMALEGKKQKARELLGDEAQPRVRVLPILGWAIQIIFYGVAINFMLWQLMGSQFSFGSVLAWGVAFYLLTAELPSFIQDCFRGVRK